MNFNCIQPNQSIVLTSTIAIELACGKDEAEIAAMGDFLSAIGQNLNLIASQKGANELCCK